MPESARRSKRERRNAGALVVAALVAGSSACSLFVDLGGLQNDSGDDDASDGAAIDTSTTDGPIDARSDTFIATDSSSDSGALDSGPPTPILFVHESDVDFDNADAGTIDIQAAKPGDTLIVATVYDGNANAKITDDRGDVFTPVVGPFGNPHGVEDYIFAAINVLGNETLLTISLTGPRPNGIELYVIEYSGIGSFDVGATNLSSGGSTLASGNITTKVAGELLFAWSECEGSVALGSGFTSRSTANADLIEDEIAGAPGSYEATSNPSGPGEILLAAFVPK